jgi:hypothetical protein
MLNGLGQIDPTSAALAIADAKHMWDDLINALGIGAGRREADVVTPVQNRIFNGSVAPLVDYLTAIHNGSVKVDCTTLTSDLAVMDAAEKQWLSFLHDTKWQDGRAAQQGEATLAPWFTNTRADAKKVLTDDCGSIATGIPDAIGKIFTTSTGDTNWPMIAGIAGVAFMLIRRK